MSGLTFWRNALSHTNLTPTPEKISSKPSFFEENKTITMVGGAEKYLLGLNLDSVLRGPHMPATEWLQRHSQYGTRIVDVHCFTNRTPYTGDCRKTKA